MVKVNEVAPDVSDDVPACAILTTEAAAGKFIRPTPLRVVA